MLTVPPDFMKLIDNICALDENELINFDDMVKSFIEKSQNSPLYEYLRKRFLYQAYFFKKLDIEEEWHVSCHLACTHTCWLPA